MKDLHITTAGGDTTLGVDDFGSPTQYLPHADTPTPTPVTYSEEVVENLLFPELRSNEMFIVKSDGILLKDSDHGSGTIR